MHVQSTIHMKKAVRQSSYEAGRLEPGFNTTLSEIHQTMTSTTVAGSGSQSTIPTPAYTLTTTTLTGTILP